MKKNLIFGIFLLIIGFLCLTMLAEKSFWLIALFLLGIYLVYRGIAGGKSVKQKAPALSKDRERYYRETGMNAREIEIFRETMNQTKADIDQLQQNFQANAKLKAIDLRHNTVKAAKALFKELVKEPQKLHYASHFLYTHLPNLVDLTNKYIEISAHEIKSKETYDKMEESILVIDQMAVLIAKDYQNFVSDDFEDIDVELSLAKQSIKEEAK